MALIIGGIPAITQVSAAITGTIVWVNKLNNENRERMEEITTEHKHSMQILMNEQNSENNRHKEFMHLLDKLLEATTLLGKIIFDAESQGCKGLPGSKSS